MDKPVVTYEESKGKILAKYVENFGRVCEVDVTDQALQAVFRYLMAQGLTLAEHCEYEVDSNKFRISLVKQEAPTIEPVKRGRWVEDICCDEVIICNDCGNEAYFDFDEGTYIDFDYCPNCGAKMERGWNE